MISFALTVARKDLLLTFTRGSGLVQGLLLGLLLLFVFSLSQGVGERMSPQGAGAVFWLGSAFCQVLIFNTLYALEEANGARLGLLLAPAPIQAVWLGKALAGRLLLLVAQMFVVPAAVAAGRALAGRRGARVPAEHRALPPAGAPAAGGDRRGGPGVRCARA